MTGSESEFVSGDERLTALRNRPDIAAALPAKREQLREADRAHAMGLAMIRRAANLTQNEIAEQLGVGQAAIAKLERRPDLLLSTLRAYIVAVGGHLRLVVDFEHGQEVELELDTVTDRPTAVGE